MAINCLSEKACSPNYSKTGFAYAKLAAGIKTKNKRKYKKVTKIYFKAILLSDIGTYKVPL
mgnify:CR=1 FL=1|jgi:hypothetical protein